jgi:nucleoside-diphosphate-sugar epimerase
VQQKALFIGGTGPTGPTIVQGLAARGFDVTIMHGGLHETDLGVSGVHHIHEDPHFREGLERGLADSTWDLVIASYGRLRVIAEYFAGRTGRLVAIGGSTAIYARDGDERWGLAGRPALFPDTTDLFVTDEGTTKTDKIAYRMIQSLNALMELHAAGKYSATYVGYPLNYGPRQPGPQEWAIIRRVLDGRRTFILADGGIKLESRIFTENAAAAVLLAVDKPEIAAGKRYSVADKHVYTMRQRIDHVARYLGHEFEYVSMPYELAWPAHALWRREIGHRLNSSSLIRQELGYEDPVGYNEAIGRTIEWLLANRPDPGGELEAQIGDPFAYEREDELVVGWRRAQKSMGDVEMPALTEQPHQYRHPKAPGEAWSAEAVTAPTSAS